MRLMNTSLFPSLRQNLNNRRDHPFLAAILLLVLCVLTYGPSLSNEFLLDDLNFLPGTSIYHFSGLSDFFLSSPNQHYQPFYFLINTALLQTFPEHPLIPRTVNLLLFFLGCLFLYKLLKTVFQNSSLALLTALLYCVHPINAVSVLQITHNAILLYVLLLEISFFCFWKKLNAPAHKHLLQAVSLVCYAAALLCFEGAVLFPLALTAGLVFLKNLSWSRAVQKTLPFYVLVFVFTIIWLRVSLPNSFVAVWTTQGPSLLSALQSYLLLVLWYLSRFMMPNNIVLMKDLPAVSPLIALFALYALFFISLFLLRFTRKNPQRSFALSWLCTGIILIFPATGAHSYMGPVLNPHWLSFYAVGGFVLIALALIEIKKRLPGPVWLGGLAGMCLSLFILTQGYVLEGAHATTFFQSWLRTCPNNYVGLSGLGTHLYRQGKFQRAFSFYRKAGRHAGTRSHENDFNLGVLLLKSGKTSGAKKLFIRSLRRDPDYPYPYHALGELAIKEGRPSSAEQYFLKAAKNGPAYLPPRIGLAQIYLQNDNTSQAIHVFEEILGLNLPRQERIAALAHLTALYYREEQPVQADRALTLLHRSAPGMEFTMILTEVFSAHGLELIALDFLKRAIHENPRDQDLYLLCGTLMANHGQLQQAISVWEEGSAIDPKDKRFEGRIKKAKALLR